MSGDQLRNFAILGDVTQLKHLLKGGANPCSLDGDGLTALHYAVWNGHEEAMKVLVANHAGTDQDGNHISSLNIKSDIGLTPLHLSVIENSESALFCRYLTMAGCDTHAKDLLDRTPYAMAKESGNEEAIKFLKQVKKNGVTKEQIAAFHDSHNAEYKVQEVRIPCTDYPSAPRDEKGELIQSREDLVPVPIELDMPEHHIFPFAENNYKAGRNDGAAAIRNLVIVTEESAKNEHRREFLANSTEVHLRKQGLMN